MAKGETITHSNPTLTKMKTQAFRSNHRLGYDETVRYDTLST